MLLGSAWDTGRPGGLATCCLLWGEEEALSGLLSSINSRMESGRSQQAAKSALFLNTHGRAKPFNPPAPHGSWNKKTVAFGLEAQQLRVAQGISLLAQKQTKDKIIL